MRRKQCQHGVELPRGLRCNHGYLEVLLTVAGTTYCRTFGQHTRDAEHIALIHLNEKRLEIRLGTFKIQAKAKILRRTFAEVAPLWLSIWQAETLPDGKPKHTARTQKETARVLDRDLIPAFGKYWYDEISPAAILAWRAALIKRGCSGTTANRYQATLGSIFSHVGDWIATERIRPAFKQPVNPQTDQTWNPSTPVEKAPVVVRERILTDYELRKLHNAFVQLADLDGWEIVTLALRSVLSLKDLQSLEIGSTIDLARAKTGVPINLPITVLVKLNWTNWKHRWEAAQELCGVEDMQFRDLRKTGINKLDPSKYGMKLIGEFAGHADEKTTEKFYRMAQTEQLRPLADDLETWVKEL